MGVRFFLFFAAKNRFVVESYVDRAVGYLEKNDAGKQAMTRVILRPSVQFAGTAPDAADLRSLHDRAHHDCYIANSVTTKVEVEPA